MINIAILHYSCPPVVGGVEEIVRQQASLFNRYYHPVKIIVGAGSQFIDEFAIEINPLLSSCHPEILKLQKEARENFKRIQEMADEIFQYLLGSLQHFEILIAHNVFSMPFNLPLTIALHKLANRKSIKVISWNHDSPYFYMNYSKELDKKPWSILKKYNPNVSYITILESRAIEFRKLYHLKSELSIIPNGIDPIRFFRLDKTTVRLIQENDLFSAELLLVQPSRLHPRKNIELSIKVLRAFHDSGVQAKLLLTGAYDPHGKKTLQYYYKIINLAQSLQVDKDIIIVAEYVFKSGEKLSADRVIIRDLYHISDLLFLPSNQEGFGIPLLEAGMIRLPIACSDIVPFKSIAGENVLYFSLKDDPKEIAEKVLEFLKNLPSHRMYRKVIRDYVWDNIYHESLKPFLEKIVTL